MMASPEGTPPLAPVGGAAVPDEPVKRPGRRGRRRRGRRNGKHQGGREWRTPPSWLALLFLLPALLLLGFLVVYPIVYSVIRSFFDASGDSFVGVDNYTGVFQGHDKLVAVRNTAIWDVVAPTLVTIAAPLC